MAKATKSKNSQFNYNRKEVKLIVDPLAAKYKDALIKVLMNLRMIDGPNVADSYIDDSIEIITNVIKEDINNG